MRQTDKVKFIGVVLFALSFAMPGSAFAATELVMFLSDTTLDSDAHPEINVMRPDGTDHRMIRTDYPVAGASIDAAGAWIAYVTKKRKELRLVHVSGKREKVLVRLGHSVGPKGPTDVSWSPDGRYVLFSRYFAGNNIGLEVYDTRLRKFTSRHILGRETDRTTGSILSVDRLLWSPDSSVFGVAAIKTRFRYSQALDAFTTLWSTVVYNRRTGKKLFDYQVESRYQYPLGFLSNSELLHYGNYRRFSVTENALSSYNFRTKRSKTLVFIGANTSGSIHGGAVSPDGDFVSFDITALQARFSGSPWSVVTGTPRDPDIPIRRTFANAHLASRAAAYSSPLTGPAKNLAHWGNGPNLSISSYEWRRVRSGAVFRTATCWGWSITVRGTDRADNIVGTAGADIIAAGSGNDRIKAGGGDDIICGGGGNDSIDGGPGADVLFGDIAANQDYVSEIIHADDDRLIGSSGNDQLYGLGGNDRISGGAGNDIMYGGDGNDTIDGGPGGDTIIGEGGTDTCRRALQTTSCE